MVELSSGTLSAWEDDRPSGVDRWSMLAPSLSSIAVFTVSRSFSTSPTAADSKRSFMISMILDGGIYRCQHTPRLPSG
ncbi:hypothetical protein EUV02_15545 [Polymorphobacter arshaanensis]|uniref:Uncharacterized protein n=1 Tax=Glacieibacterium arshaanense TaxID=2511025 RepID=A0A4Y9EJI3_9SPHN|nr:hypothetical protein EUV02_15545 [Polymorphobacter arshaanensis]